MGRLVLLVASGLVVVSASIAGAPASAAPRSSARIEQYNPDVPPTTAVAPAEITTPRSHGVDAPAAGTLPSTGSDSRRLAGDGLALALAGTGIVLVGRRSRSRRSTEGG